ncbi:MAG: alpha-glucosidase [Clostridiales bacterium]|nr:alpha-glucosidase [Clostridiales bacterium]
MIRRFDYGAPLKTDALVKDVPLSADALPYFTVTETDGGVCFTHALGKDDLIFGLGETVRGINKRGHLYRSWNTDEFSHLESKESLYASHNLLIFSGQGSPFGVFFDDPGEVVFDLGYTDANTAAITSVNGNVSVILIEEDELNAIVRAFRSLIGQSYLPPKWAFGYIQSRWGYAADSEVRAIVREHRDRHIPLDGVCLDIDYMVDYKDFSWNRESFPDLKKLSKDMKEDHIRLIPIIDAGVKEQSGYDVCDEGVANGYFCTYEDGSPFVGAVWPGRSYFPDFFRPEVRRWFGDKYHALLDQGIEGFWNDMNEPALFYSENGLKAAHEELNRLLTTNIGLDAFFHLKDVVLGMANNRDDYRSFYHQHHGKRMRHDKVHNLYGAYMTQAAAEGLRSYDPDKRFLLFSRASYVGAHRHGGVWQGDNSSWWSHILLNLKMLPSLNMCGFLYTGADLGGFSSNTTEDLLLRWLQLGAFTPLMRNHSALHTRDQEIYRFGMQEDMRNILTVRYALLPYLYSEFMKCALTQESMFRPLAFDYPADQTALRVEDQIMLGKECMIAPVYQQNARGRYVYLPEDMLLVRFRSAADYDLLPMEQGHHWIDLQLNEMPLFIRKGCIIPLSRGGEWVEAVDFTDLTLLGWLDGAASYELYDDDGTTTQPVLADGLNAILCGVKDGRAFADGKGLTVDASRVIVNG